MKNSSTTFSPQTLLRAYVKSLLTKDLGEFVFQQAEIEFLLTILIEIRAGLLDKKLKKTLEKLPLGGLVSSFKLVAQKTEEEKKLIKNLKKYVSRRNFLIHKITGWYLKIIKSISIKNLRQQRLPISTTLKGEIEKTLKLKKTLQLGDEILSSLGNLHLKEISKIHSSIGKLVQKTEKKIKKEKSKQ